MLEAESLKWPMDDHGLRLMLDIQIFRDNPASIRADFSKRGIDDTPIDEVIRLDESWRQIRYEVDQLRKEKNSAARGIASAKKSGDEDEFKRIMDEVSISER